MPTNHALPVNAFYDGRSSFTIIGLTGVTGSGCSTLADIIASRDFLSRVRKPSDILIPENRLLNNDDAFGIDNQKVNNKVASSYVFKRKYTICYDFAVRQYKSYTIIKYTHIIWLYAFLELYGKQGRDISVDSLKNWVIHILKNKFKPSKNHDSRFKEETGYDEETRDEQIVQIVEKFDGYNAIVAEIRNLPFEIRENNYVDILPRYSYELKEFFKKGSNFDNLLTYLFERLGHVCCYSLSFLHHKMACQIRKSGSLEEDYHEVFNRTETNYDHLYDLVWLLSVIIRGYRRKKEDDKIVKDGCQIVIDSIRNSMEALYLKERYSAFYLIAVHDERTRQSNLLEKVRKQMPDVSSNIIEAVAERMEDLSHIEVQMGDYKKGKFSSPNIEQTIADAEIHIINNKANSNIPIKESERFSFRTMEEQWMKYSSLILHPGLITPSSEERCMVVAYTAKFNSACLSRQVGAVITNQYHCIRTIGWNDVPFGQVPCSLRALDRVSQRDCPECVYSEFERSNYSSYHDGGNFKEHVANDYPSLPEQAEQLSGLSFSYCFKTLHNRYEGEANQVFTRSLHAEENAILQMAKYGGEPLMNGIIYVTASPCELCAKKLYQIGVRKIVYIDPYPGISRQHIIRAGFKQPALKQFQGVYGSTYFKLYHPFMSYKDEIDIRIGHNHRLKTKDTLLEEILKKKKLEMKNTYTPEEIKKIVDQIQ